ncbi:MAG TPA: hypothetical protein VGF32_32160 [Streptosporangiaceae bacterium]
MPDPLTLPLHETAIVATAVITFAGIVRWFQDQRHLTAGNAVAGPGKAGTGTRGGPDGMNWRIPLLTTMVIFHLAPPSAPSSS